jgi:putative spermidine/putrescine transport system permease protein
MIIEAEPSRRAWWLLLPTGVLYTVAFAVPLGLVAVYSLAQFKGGVTTFGLHLDNYRSALGDGFVLPVLLRTMRLAATITLACLALGIPVALQMRRSGPKLRLLLMFIVVSPILTSVIVRNVAFLLILGKFGIVNEALYRLGLIAAPLELLYNDFAVVVGVVHVYLPFMALPVYASMSAIEPRIEETAASLGAPRLLVFLSVTLPLSLPGIVAGVTLVFILSMGIYVTPVILGGGFVVTTPMIISDLVRNQYNWPQGSAVSVLLLVVIGFLVAILGWLRPRHAR